MIFSMSSSDETLLRQIIMDHYRNPRNKGLINDKKYHTVHLKNPSCGDDLTVQLAVSDGKITDVRQSGAGCSICCSSASMMSELIKGHTLSEAQSLIKNFRNMVESEPYNEADLGDAISLQGVSHLPQRVKCATLSWLACQQGIDEIEAGLPSAAEPRTVSCTLTEDSLKNIH